MNNEKFTTWVENRFSPWMASMPEMQEQFQALHFLHIGRFVQGRTYAVMTGSIFAPAITTYRPSLAKKSLNGPWRKAIVVKN